MRTSACFGDECAEFRVSYKQHHRIIPEQYLLLSLSCLLNCIWLCDPVDCSMPGFSVLHYLPEIAPAHVHWVGDAIQPSHPVSPTSPPALNLSQHQHLFQWVSSASGGQNIGASASVLPMNRQGWVPLGLTGLISLQSEGLSKVLQHHSLKALILHHLAIFGLPLWLSW